MQDNNENWNAKPDTALHGPTDANPEEWRAGCCCCRRRRHQRPHPGRRGRSALHHHHLRPPQLPLRAQSCHQRRQEALRGPHQEDGRRHLHGQVPQVQRLLRRQEPCGRSGWSGRSSGYQEGGDLRVQPPPAAPADRLHQRAGDGRVHTQEQRRHKVRHHPRRRRHLPDHILLQPQLLPERPEAGLPEFPGEKFLGFPAMLSINPPSQLFFHRWCA